MVDVLEIFIRDQRVGTIANLTDDRNVFAFDDSYLNNPNRPTLSLSFLSAERDVLTPTKTPRVKLLPFFSNLLPEGHLRGYLATRANVSVERDFPLLWLLGEDLPGAATARHPDGVAPPRENDRGSRPLDDPALLKFSLAGVQLKFSAILETSGGLSIPVSGQNGQWILKMPSATYAGVPENEFAMMTFARKVGIEVPEISLIDPSNIRNLPPNVRTDLGAALTIKRFDRAGTERIHIEDFNQVFNQYPADKYRYASYGNVLAALWRHVGEADTQEFVRRLVFNIGIGNADMHLKNWSIIYRDGRTPQLAPAYDFLSTVVYIPNDALALSIARTKDWFEITFERLERFARRAEVPPGVVLAAAREMVERMNDTWPALLRDCDVPEPVARAVRKQMESVPIFAGQPAQSALPTPERHEEID